MVNLTEVPATAVTHADVQVPAWAASASVTVSGFLACAAVRCVMPPSAGKGRSLPRVSPVAYLCQPIQGRPSTRKPVEYTTRIAVFGGGAKGPHPLREPEPV